MRLLVPGAALAHRLGLPRLARRPRVRKLAPKLATMIAMTPSAPAKRAVERLPSRFEAQGEKRGTVALLQGCVQRVFFWSRERGHRARAGRGGLRGARAASAALLWRASHARGRRSRGARLPAQRSKRWRTTRRSWSTPPGAVRHEGLRPHAARRARLGLIRADRFAEKAKDANEFLAAVEPRAERRPVAMKIAYHDACHLAHAQKIRSQPRELLEGIPDLELVEPSEWELVLRLSRDLQPGQAGARRRAGRAQGPQPARHRRRGGGGSQSGLRPADHRAHRPPGPRSAGAASDGAAGPLDRDGSRGLTPPDPG